MKVELKAKPPISLFIVDAPTAVKDVETKDAVYDVLLTEIRKDKSAHRITLIAEDFNARLSKARNEFERSFIGHHPYEGARVPRGKRAGI